MKRGPENFDNMSSFGAEMKRQRGNGKFEVRLLIPSKTAGSIIGRSGANIKELRQKNNANVRIPDNVGPERVVLIQTEDTQTAIDVIEQTLPYMFEDGNDSKPRETQYAISKPQEVRLLIHESIVGGIIGRGGSTINQIEKESGAKVHAYQTCAPQSSDRCVVVKGTTEELLAALSQIMSFLATREVQGYHEIYDPNNFDCFYANEYGGFGTPRDAMAVNEMPVYQRGNSMQFPGPAMFGGANSYFPGQHGLGMAGFGNNMNNFNMNGAPTFPKDDVMPFGNNMSKLSPPSNDEDEGPIQTSKVTVPRDMGGAIIGPGGARIRKVRMDSKAEIKVDEPEDGSDSRVITITGTPQRIQTAQYLLQQCVRLYGNSSRGGHGR